MKHLEGCVFYTDHWATRTMPASIRLDGATTCMTADCATDGDVFEAYVRRVLASTLRRGDEEHLRNSIL